MPQGVQQYLDSLDIPVETKAAIWDAVYASEKPEDIQKGLDALQLPDSVKADVWDARFAAPAAPTGTGVSDEVPVVQGDMQPPAEGEGGSLLPSAAATGAASLALGSETGRRAIRHTIASGVGGGLERGAQILPRFLGGPLGATAGGRIGAMFGMPFAGATTGAAAGSSGGRGIAGPVERFGRVLQAGAGFEAAHPAAERAAEFTQYPHVQKARELERGAKAATREGAVHTAKALGKDAADALKKGDKLAKKDYLRAKGIRSIADAVLGNAARNGRITSPGALGIIGKALGPVAAALGGYELFNIGKDIYDREKSGEDVPASEIVTAGGLGLLGLLPTMGSAAKAARTVSSGGRTAAAVANAQKVANASKGAIGTTAQAGRASGAGPVGKTIREEADELAQEIMSGKTGGTLPDDAPRGAVIREMAERRGTTGGNVERMSATDAVRSGQGPSGGRRGVTGASRSRPPADPPNLQRQSATEAVASGQGPSGGARGVTGASRAQSPKDPANLTREPETLAELMAQAEKEGLNPAAVAHRVGEWMRARGVHVEGASLPRPKK